MSISGQNFDLLTKNPKNPTLTSAKHQTILNSDPINLVGWWEMESVAC